MKQKIILCLIMLLTGCSGLDISPADNVVKIPEKKPLGVTALPLKEGATMRIKPYTDARMMGNPYKVGTGGVNVSGLRGKDIILDQDAATIVNNAMKQRMAETGFRMKDEPDSIVLFELSGVIKELTYNVMARDVIAINIETTLTELGSGKVLWSGIVAEKNERFAGVAGNNKEDIAKKLREELDIVTAKTSDAISASLMVSHPHLFNLTPGIKPIPGVTVLVAPVAASAPVATEPIPAEPVSANLPRTSASSGLLLINTTPARAKIYLDNVYYGLSPLRLEMEAGIHALSVKLDGYKMTTEQVSVRKGDSTEMEVTLER
ncbi:MAG: PEGA domain-containing protein [Gallionellaceae bacterium]|nr:PEGA domain-containing protein [Gallionellaceae bacterium]